MNRRVDMGQRITKRMAELGMSQSELARRVGLAQPTIHSLINRNKRGSTHLHKIARELETTPAFLSGETDDPSEGAQPVPSAREVAEQLDAVLIPEVQVSFSMGGGSVHEDWPVIQLVPMSRAWLRGLTPSAPEHLMVARGDGDSMMPTILDNDLVIIDRAQNTPKQQDRIWALSIGGLGMIKRLRGRADGSYEVHSDNPSVRPIEAVDGELHVVGRVVGVVRRI